MVCLYEGGLLQTLTSFDSYMNSSLQALQALPELRKALRAYRPSQQSDRTLLIQSFGDLINQLENTG